MGKRRFFIRHLYAAVFFLMICCPHQSVADQGSSGIGASVNSYDKYDIFSRKSKERPLKQETQVAQEPKTTGKDVQSAYSNESSVIPGEGPAAPEPPVVETSPKASAVIPELPPPPKNATWKEPPKPKETPKVKEPEPKETPKKQEPEKPVVKETPKPAEPQPKVEEKVPAKKEEPKDAAKEAEYARSVGSAAPDISKEVFEEDKKDILAIIDKLNDVMKNRDYKSWLKYVDGASAQYWTKRTNLQKAENRLPVKGLTLRNLEDYFKYVFIPARNGRRIDEIRYEDRKTVKAVQVNGDVDTVYYYFKKSSDDTWKLHLPPISD